MRNRVLPVLAVCLATSALASAARAAAGAPDGVAFFEQTIRPLLVSRCYECHATTAKKVKGDLLLDSKPGWTRGGEMGPVIVPGKPDESLLIQAVRYAHGDLKMPPKGKLPQAEIDALAQWVRLGAPDPREGPALSQPAQKKGIDLEAGKKLWSLQPLSHPAAPPVKDAGWCRGDIDRFILARLEAKGIAPNGPVDRRKLIRRAYFDLHGLPPAPQEVESFVADPDPAAYEKLIDRLLASPRYGERWASYWLDVVRFAESDGFEHDYDRPYAYHYRDFVIRALNDDLPFDTFAKWQLAGDEYEPDNPQAMMATGFLTAGVFPTQITEKEFESTRYNQLDDMVSTTGVAFLGLTIGCARCHDHKFDPIPTEDYYRLAATFTTAVHSDVEMDLLPPQERASARQAFDAKRAALATRIEAFEREHAAAACLGTLPEYQQLKLDVVALEMAGPTRRTAKVQVTTEGLPPVKNHADDRGYPHFYPQTYILRRGDPNQKVEPAAPSFLRVLMRDGDGPSRWQQQPPPGARTSYRRRALAEWLTDVDHGAGALAARVAVNRLWQHHLGRGIVATPSDFGTRGAPPTHPVLLDYLASKLVESGWRLKPLHRQIMLSNTYQAASAYDPAKVAADPENELLWRRPVRRLESEAIRDAMLSVAGELDTTMYGRGTLDPKSKRRSVYFTVKRSSLIPMMLVFDAPEALTPIANRSTTTIAPQALLLMNNPQVRGYAKKLATRVWPTTSTPPEGAVRSAYEIALSRPATAEEVSDAVAFVAEQAAAYKAAAKPDAERLALADFCQAVLCLNEFVYVD